MVKTRGAKLYSFQYSVVRFEEVEIQRFLASKKAREVGLATDIVQAAYQKYSRDAEGGNRPTQHPSQSP